MAKAERSPYYRATPAFVCEGKKQFVDVGAPPQRVRRCVAWSKRVVEEITLPISRSGCYIHEIGVSPSGTWLVTQRISGQSEWGYDVFRTVPLAQEPGVESERGYLLELPRFAPDELFLVGIAGMGLLGGWWAAPDQDPDEPARGGAVSLGFLFVHRLPSHRVTRHDLRVKLPKGWVPKDPWNGWQGPEKLTVGKKSVRFVPPWGVPVEVKLPLPRVAWLPVPHPSGRGLL